MRPPSRREFLAAGAAAILPVRGAQAAPDADSLAGRARRKGLIYGAALATSQLDLPRYPDVFAAECGALVPEWETKWDPVQRQRGRFDFTRTDRLIGFAEARGLQFRGHAFLWHRAMPGWLDGALTAETAETIMRDHIAALAGRYRGRVQSWDVVNEAIEPNDGRSDFLRQTPWLRALGPRYLDIAFHAAHQADPSALLCYNDYSLDYATASEEKRRTAVLKLLGRLKSRGAPIGALGVQAHLGVDNRPFDAAVLRRFLADVAALGLKIIISELDVRDRELPADIPVRDAKVADMAERYLAAALDERAVIAVLTWGLSDRYSWLSRTDSSKRRDGLEVRGLPFDGDLARKPIWAAMARAFDTAPAR